VATVENNQIAEQRVLEESTMWCFAALLFLLGFSTLDIIVKSTSGGNTASYTRTVIIEAVTSTQ
jgi:hypothetical protein